MKTMIAKTTGLLFVLLFSTVVATANASSNMELQRSIQKNMAAIETNQMELSAIKSESDARVARVEGELMGLESSLAAVPPDSSEYLEVKTRFTELLVQRGVEKFKADTERKEIAQKLAERAWRLEGEIESSNRRVVSGNSVEIQRLQDTVGNIVDEVLADIELESVNMVKFENQISGSSEWNRIRTERNNVARSAYALRRTAKARTSNARTGKSRSQKANIGSMRSDFETLVMELDADLANSEQMLMDLKLNAEMQAMAILDKIVMAAGARARTYAEVEYNQKAIKKADDINERWTKLTEPKFDY